MLTKPEFLERLPGLEVLVPMVRLFDDKLKLPPLSTKLVTLMFLLATNPSASFIVIVPAVKAPAAISPKAPVVQTDEVGP